MRLLHNSIYAVQFHNQQNFFLIFLALSVKKRSKIEVIPLEFDGSVYFSGVHPNLD